MVNETTEMKSCIEAIEECLHQCQHCAGHDIREGNMAECALACLDCAAICEATLGAMARHSAHHGDFAKLCAHLCRECAVECRKHDQEHCRRCAEACEGCGAQCDKHASEADV